MDQVQIDRRHKFIRCISDGAGPTCRLPRYLVRQAEAASGDRLADGEVPGWVSGCEVGSCLLISCLPTYLTTGYLHIPKFTLQHLESGLRFWDSLSVPPSPSHHKCWCSKFCI